MTQVLFLNKSAQVGTADIIQPTDNSDQKILHYKYQITIPGVSSKTRFTTINVDGNTELQQNFVMLITCDQAVTQNKAIIPITPITGETSKSQLSYGTVIVYQQYTTQPWSNTVDLSNMKFDFMIDNGDELYFDVYYFFDTYPQNIAAVYNDAGTNIITQEVVNDPETKINTEDFFNCVKLIIKKYKKKE